ncbi:MAG: NAD(P)/FAD-dependent oxidoreductase [Bacteroidetes bacterium]|nr:NAD(P)/FAD-dependent oxidoreductase [Bacteroidota bacterium]
MNVRSDVLVIGAGAAGLMCAIDAGKRGRTVRVLERSHRPGSKILISGGGRCNFTNLDVSAKNVISENPDFCRSALARYNQTRFIDLVRSHGIEFYEKKKGQLFCRENAKQILDLLLSKCADSGVTIDCSVEVQAIEHEGSYRVTTNGDTYNADSLVIATGGASIPQMGATRFAYGVAEQFGLRIVEPRPGLVPLIWSETDSKQYELLAGVSLPVVVRNGRATFNDDLLFTHRGLSGPAILQISSYWLPGEEITIDLTAGRANEYAPELLRIRGGTVAQLLLTLLPKRMAAVWEAKLGFTRSITQLSKADLTTLSESLCAWRISPAGTEGFAKAEVTVGGVDTRELSSKTMEALKRPGLYFIGEAVDVTGWLGGYNFQWAWSSGWAAGQVV